MSLRCRAEMIAPANIMGITEDRTGMKLVGGEEGCGSKDEESSGLVRSAVLLLYEYLCDL